MGREVSLLSKVERRKRQKLRGEIVSRIIKMDDDEFVRGGSSDEKE